MPTSDIDGESLPSYASQKAVLKSEKQRLTRRLTSLKKQVVDSKEKVEKPLSSALILEGRNQVNASLKVLREQTHLAKSFIELQDIPDGDIETEVESVMQALDDYEAKVEEVLIECQAALYALNWHGQDSGSTSAQRDLQSFLTKNNAKLPAITLEKFSGNIMKFQKWWDTFNSAVHRRQDLDDAQKFSYLLSYLSGKAADSISGFSQDERNYNAAVDRIHQRFNKKRETIASIIRDILKHPMATKNVEQVPATVVNVDGLLSSYAELKHKAKKQECNRTSEGGFGFETNDFEFLARA
ncbi:uncharacterized protein LOC131891298 [Tigriopus californicus]|uniref:uncharacterized protein LOC131891298 n=1 Tax=Tigriopus californicus TaxID=6832 RepID=UPI0027D9D51A|nr:uncharacterized protein LOC131891298 [Tigriopus californicus]